MENQIAFPKRIRLLQTLRAHLYDRVKNTLATDKEIKQLQGLNDILERKFVLMATPKKRKVFCSLKCGFSDTFTPDEFGVDYFQAVGTCPGCGAPTVYKNGQPTHVIVEFKLAESKEVTI